MTDTLTVPPSVTFASFGLRPDVMQGVTAAGFTEPSPVQRDTIPHILAGRDLVALARTGTGKTAAFGLPSLCHIDCKKKDVQMLVIAPTRELAAQVGDEIFRLGRFAGVRCVTVVGGQSGYRQVDMIGRGAQVVVATPGRLRDLLESGRLPKFSPKIVVLDEADEMLDMGFMEDLEAILAKLPAERQTLLFSATMPPAIANLTGRFLKNPAKVDLTGGGTVTTDIRQHVVVVQNHERFEAVARIIDGEDKAKVIVFCRTKIETSDLANMLIGRGVAARAIHGDIEQDERTRTIKAFRDNHCDVLVATDVAARGLDIGGVTHVINCHLPFDRDSYVHRIGRTGRAGKTGSAITLVTPAEFHALRRLAHAIKATVLPAEVPTLADLTRRDGKRLVEAARESDVDPAAVEVVAALTASLDPVEAAVRLASLLLDKRKRTGPERVGLGTEVTQRLLSDKPRTGGAPTGRKPPYRGGGGGGGNYPPRRSGPPRGR